MLPSSCTRRSFADMDVPEGLSSMAGARTRVSRRFCLSSTGFSERLVARMRQLDEQSLSVSHAEELERSRKGNKGYFDRHKRMRPDPQQLHVGDLVLLFQSKNLNSLSVRNKLDDRWFGPYRIREI